MLTHSGLDHLRFASLSHVDDLPFIISQRYDFWHLQAPFNKSKPKTTLTVETTIVLLICDKICQNLYKSVPIFTSFPSYQVSFLYFHFNLTFLWFIYKPLPAPPLIGEGNHVMVGEVFSIKLVILSNSEESCASYRHPERT